MALTGWSVAEEPEPVSNLLRYIDRNWQILERSNKDLVRAAEDPKLQAERYPVYVSPRENLDAIRQRLAAVLSPQELERLDLRVLPVDAHGLPDYPAIRQHGLLYLPHPYVVPGGRFNEMYGWDSYFIVLGLLRDGQVERARWMTENHLYQVEHYGRVLNANRTYYLTRSQPPFLTSMVLEVYRRTGDRAWLAAAVPAIQRYYEFWTSEPHHVPETGLARYYDLGDGPAPEVLSDEKDAQGRTHYDRIRAAYQARAARWNPEDYPLDLYYRDGQLTPLFYKGDRTMRESGFDPSDRFGPFNVDVVHYNPVDLNCLLHRMEVEAGDIAEALGQDRAPWDRRAAARREALQRYCWDEEKGLFLDYNFRTGKRRYYPFGTAFFPLWERLATPEQARRTADNLPLLERPGGLVTSPYATGNQWDAPFGWAPLQLVAVEGLANYGMRQPAERLAVKFLSLVLQEFQRTGVIVEKYDVERRTSAVSHNIEFGYSTNEVGFGWTNAVFTRLYDWLPESRRKEVLR
ncbi:MAG: trehalase family glycosidase [Candidatus Eremiobacterota bacterium]